ncbi:hypothetical protein Tco_0867995 [Tanacetum coccineum]
MMLLALAITQKFSTPTNNRPRTSSNTRNQAVIQDGRVDIQTKTSGYDGNGYKNNRRQNQNQATITGNVHYARECPKPRVRDAKYFREQMLLAMKDEAGNNLNDAENDFMLDNAYDDETLEELTTVMIMMDRLQPTDNQNEHVSQNEKLNDSDRIVYKMDQSIQTIHMLEKSPNKFYDPFLKARLGYKNPERLKKAIAVQLNMYDGERFQSNNLTINSPDSEENLEEAKEIQENELVEEVEEMFKFFKSMQEKVESQQSTENSFQKDIDRFLEASLTREISDYVLLSIAKQKNKLLMLDIEKRFNDSKDVQANLLKRIKILEYDFQRSQKQSIDFKLKLQNQKDK